MNSLYIIQSIYFTFQFFNKNLTSINPCLYTVFSFTFSIPIEPFLMRGFVAPHRKPTKIKLTEKLNYF